MITFKTTLGDIQIELDFDNAPVTAKNFQQYAEDGFYNGT
ncbi:MAG: peptidylprolyl isomerase, partial [Cognaticolwellia aestuarii]